jgi:hypothetical protein
MVPESDLTAPGDTMGITDSTVETARIEALLSRLEHDAGGTCQVAGCLHLHEGPAAREDLPVLAA